MKYYNYFYYFGKSIASWWVVFLLLTYYNDLPIQNTTQLVESQLLNPFVIVKGQSLSFMRIIMVLGLSFISFLNSITLVSEICKGFKQLVMIHSKSTIEYQLSLLKLLVSNIYIEYFLFFSGIIGVLYINRLPWFSVEFGLFLLSWFILDSLVYFLILYYISDEIFSIVLMTITILIRYFLLKNICFAIGLYVLLYIFIISFRRIISARDN
ncbi:membrane protein [Streptococcus porcinus]|nr:membrane protein [Streptococcus porcinus]